MKCKFGHDGICCNSGSLLYKTTCYPDICGSCVPMTHGDAFRAKTNKELAEFLATFVSIIDCPKEVWDLSCHGLRYKDAWLEWLESPVED